MLSLVNFQQTSPSPVCPGDDVVFTCTVTASANESGPLLLYFSNPLNDQDRVVIDPAEITISANNSTVGPFTTKIVEASNESIVATATMKGITSEDCACIGIKCRDIYGNENVLYVDLGKKKRIEGIH